jgi:hypothetical protein
LVPLGPNDAIMPHGHLGCFTSTSPGCLHPPHRTGRSAPAGAKLGALSLQVVHNLIFRLMSPSTLQRAQWTGRPPRGPKEGDLPQPHFLFAISTSPSTLHPAHRSGVLVPAGANDGAFSPHVEHILCLRLTSPPTLQPAQCTALPPAGPNDGSLPHPHFALTRLVTSPVKRQSWHRSIFSAPTTA